MKRPDPFASVVFVALLSSRTIPLLKLDTSLGSGSVLVRNESFLDWLSLNTSFSVKVVVEEGNAHSCPLHSPKQRTSRFGQNHQLQTQ